MTCMNTKKKRSIKPYYRLIIGWVALFAFWCSELWDFEKINHFVAIIWAAVNASIITFAGYWLMIGMLKSYKKHEKTHDENM